MSRRVRVVIQATTPKQKPCPVMLGYPEESDADARGSTTLGVPTMTFDAFMAEQRQGGGPVRLRVKRHSEKATLPYRATSGSAGYDLCSAEECTLGPGGRKAVDTEISVEVPAGHYGRVAPRSGLAVKQGVNVLAGVIDSDYRGKVAVVLVNHGYDSFHVKEGDRIAQLILEKISTPDVEEITEHTATERGAGGFGSTGV